MYQLSTYIITFSTMNNLTESEQIVLISIVLGFLSGIVFALIDSLLELIFKKNKMSFIKFVRLCIYLGITMGIVFGVMTFASISIDPTSIQQLNRMNINMAIIFGLFTPVLFKIVSFIFSREYS